MPKPIMKAAKVKSSSAGSCAIKVMQVSAAKATSGPAVSAQRSRVPDQPETQNEAMVQPSEITIVTKLTKIGETPCTTCSSKGRNKVTEVCAIACMVNTQRQSPIGALSESACEGKSLLPALRSRTKVEATKRTAVAMRVPRNIGSSTGPVAATAKTPTVSMPRRKKGKGGTAPRSASV